MPAVNPARDKIAHQLQEAIDRLRTDLVRVEMWANALDVFVHPIPEYDPSDNGLQRHLMPSQRARSKPATSDEQQGDEQARNRDH